MRGVNIDGILKTLGWDQGFRIPVANEENQKLEEEVARLTLHKIRSKNAYENACTKNENLENHLKYLLQESDLNERFYTAQRQQLEEEEHNYRVKIMKKDSMEQEIKQIQKEMNEISQRQEAKKLELQRGHAKLDKLKTEIDWDQEALNAWEEALKKRDEDNEIIKKFSREDEKKFIELEARRAALQVELVERSQTIDKMVSDIISYERILERTGKTLKQQMMERDNLVKTWKDSVNMLRQQDDDIKRSQQHLIDIHGEVHKQKELLEEQTQFLENEKDNNYQVSIDIEEINVMSGRVRKEYYELIQTNAQLTNDMTTTQKQMSGRAFFLQKERSRTKQLQLDFQKMTKRSEGLSQQIKKLESKLDQLSKKSVSQQERMAYLDNLLNCEEKLAHSINIDMELLQRTSFRNQKLLQEVREKKRNKESEIDNCKTAIATIKNAIAAERERLQKNKEVIFEMDIRIDRLESKVLQIENKHEDVDSLELVEREKKLQQLYNEHVEVDLLLKDQMRRIEQDMSKLSFAITADTSQLNSLKDKLQNEIMLFEGGQKIVANAKLKSQECQVEENMLRLRVLQFEKTMQKEENSIYTLRKFRVNLEQLTRERLIEINTNREILLAKKRNLEDDKGRLKGDITIRLNRINILKKKYHGAIMLLGKDEEGQPLSIAHFKVRNSQMKFILQKEGDELDLKIRKAETDIIAMENTLKVVNVVNHNFRSSLSAVDEDGVEETQMKVLEKELRDKLDSLQQHKNILLEKKQELKELHHKMNSIETERTELAGKLESCQLSLNNIEERNKATVEKIERANCHIKKTLKKLRGKSVEKYEKDLEIRQLKDANTKVLSRLSYLSKEYLEMGPLIKRYAQEYSVDIPDRTISQSSSSSMVSRTETCLSVSSGRSSVKTEPVVQTESPMSTLLLKLDTTNKEKKMRRRSSLYKK